MHLLFWVLYIIVWGIRGLAFALTFFDTLDSNVIGSLVYALGTYKNLYVLVPSVLFIKQRVLYSVIFIVSKSQVSSIEGNTIHIDEQQIPIAPNLRSEVLDKILGDKFWKRG